MRKLSQQQRQAEEIARIEADIAAANAQPAEPEAPEPETPEPLGTPPETQPVYVAPPQPADDTWRQRYLTLEGKYKAEVPRLHAEVRELKASLETAIAKMSAAPAPEKPAPAKSKLVTDKDAETFGSDLIDLIKRQAQELVSEREVALNEVVKELRAENASLKANVTSVTKTQEATAQEAYVAQLTALVPDWETVNRDQGFLTWLEGQDPLSGLARQALIDNAYQQLDAKRTAVIFNAWKGLQPAQPPAPPQPKPEVQRQVTPGKSKQVPASPASDASGKIWSHAEIENFYRDVRAGLYVGKAAEVAQVEAEIDLAVSTGRIR